MEGKKAFVVYTNWKEYIDDLNDKQVGMWTRWMFEYCNDKWNEKEIEYPADAAVKVLCKLTKDALKRDLKKYKEKKKRIDEINERKRNKVDTTSRENNNEIVNDIDNEIDDSNKLIVNSNKLIEISKDINNNVSFNKETMAEASKNEAQPLITLPCLKGYNHKIFEEDVKHYQELYPAVDILQELRLMLGWLEANPNNRKTQSGIKSFITRWLSKVQNKAKGDGNRPKIKFNPLQSVDETDEEYQERLRKWEEECNGGFERL